MVRVLCLEDEDPPDAEASPPIDGFATSGEAGQENPNVNRVTAALGCYPDCLAAHELYKELECDADELAAIEAEMSQAELDGRSWLGSSYTTQEIVGIGGRVKKKVKKRIMVGDVVKEYEDERGSNTYLQREQNGANRSWCSWCERVVLGKKDLERPAMSSESVASSSSGGSV
ncbi:hypothetical protein B0A48_17974 [Cryoendolithus antarcticus]|uniref:Uncharacterized protein n=1 Tax=Cryoendolithus antarcticus TaxID=1507870 RepID=A0A1V8S956_9PEZI|nr:hypothetical protein B0A48_17974 [Cryoendolithus antarcticus]